MIRVFVYGLIRKTTVGDSIGTGYRAAADRCLPLQAVNG